MKSITLHNNRKLTRSELQDSAKLTIDIPKQCPRQLGNDGPCPWISCKHHLYGEVTEIGSLRIYHRGIDPTDLVETCAIDVADRKGLTLEEVGELLGTTRECVRQIEVRALIKIRGTKMAQGLAKNHNIDTPKPTSSRLPHLRECAYCGDRFRLWKEYKHPIHHNVYYCSEVHLNKGVTRNQPQKDPIMPELNGTHQLKTPHVEVIKQQSTKAPWIIDIPEVAQSAEMPTTTQPTSEPISEPINKRIEVRKRAQAAAARIGELRQQGLMIETIADKLNAECYLTPTGQQWSIDNVSATLRKYRSDAMPKFDHATLDGRMKNLYARISQREITTSQAAQMLNADSVPTPSGKKWTMNTITCYYKRRRDQYPALSSCKVAPNSSTPLATVGTVTALASTDTWQPAEQAIQARLATLASRKQAVESNLAALLIQVAAAQKDLQTISAQEQAGRQALEILRGKP